MHDWDAANEAVKRDFETSWSRAMQSARSQVTNELNQSLRRLRQYNGESEWLNAVLDAASQFAHQTAIFSLQGGELRLRAQRKLELPNDLTFALASRHAFANAVTSKDLIVALRTPAEVGAELSTQESGGRGHIVPILNADRVVAILFAVSGDYTDVNGLELVAGLASLVLERQANAALNVQIAPPVVVSGSGPVSNAAAALPAWADLNEEQHSSHVRAQRFARVRVAEMQLENPEACRAGREQNDLYLFLKKSIDAARESYRNQFMTTPHMVDYLHLELVRTAAEGNESTLGADYPGELA